MREMQIPLSSGGLYAVGSDGLHGRESLGSGLAVGSELISASRCLKTAIVRTFLCNFLFLPTIMLALKYMYTNYLSGVIETDFQSQRR